MKNNKGFTIVEVVVSIVLVMVVVLYLIRTIIATSDKNNELLTQQEYIVYENNLLKSFYSDADNIQAGTQLEGIQQIGDTSIKYLDLKNGSNPIELTIDPTENNNRIIYNNVVYKLPNNVTFSPKAGKYYDITTVKRKKNENDKYGMVITNIYVKVYDKEEVIKLMYQGNLQTHRVNFYKNLDSSLTDEKEEPYTYVDIMLGDYLTSNLLPNQPSNNPHSFKGWYKSRTGNDKLNLGEKGEKITSDMNLYAHWGESDFYVVFDPNDQDLYGSATGVMYDFSMTIGATESLPRNTFELTGYEFIGWNDEENGNGEGYIDEADFGSISEDDLPKYPKSSDGKPYIKLYAQWMAKQYDIVYEGNGGTHPEDGSTTWSGKISYTDSYEVHDNVRWNNWYTRTGYNFSGWYGNKNGTGKNYVGWKTDKWIWDEGWTLYAGWTAKVLNVNYVYSGNYSNCTYSTRNATRWTDQAVFGQSYTAQNNWWTCPGWKFVEWNEKADGTGTSWTAGGTWSQWGKWGDDLYDHDVTLYAIWEPEQYDVKYVYRDEDLDSSCNPRFTAWNYKTWTDPTKATYGQSYKTTFNWWNCKTKNFLYWQEANGTIWYEEYTWKRWGKYKNDYYNHPVTLYAVWKNKTLYTVDYDCNKPSTASTNMIGSTPKSRNYEGSNNTISENGCELEGYVFDGWYTKSNGTGTKYTEGQSVALNTNMTLFAKWKPSTYTVVYDKKYSAATGTTASSTHTFDTAKALTANGYSMKGYKFDSWNTVKSPTFSTPGVEYSDKQSVKNLTSSGSITLYAQWAPKDYTLTVNPNGGTYEGTTDSTILSVVYDTNHSSYIGVPKKTGYTFTGWYDSSNKLVYDTKGNAVTTTGYWSADSSDSNYKMWKYDGSLTVTAHWTPNSYTLTVDPNGGTYKGTTSKTTLTVVYDTNQNNNIGVPTRSGYTFYGWYTSLSSGTIVFDKSGKALTSSGYWKAAASDSSYIMWVHPGNLTVHAIWTNNTSKDPTPPTITAKTCHYKYTAANNPCKNAASWRYARIGCLEYCNIYFAATKVTAQDLRGAYGFASTACKNQIKASEHYAENPASACKGATFAYGNTVSYNYSDVWCAGEGNGNTKNWTCNITLYEAPYY